MRDSAPLPALPAQLLSIARWGGAERAGGGVWHGGTLKGHSAATLQHLCDCGSEWHPQYLHAATHCALGGQLAPCLQNMR